MENRSLHDRLEQLHGELIRVETIDESQRVVLQQLRSDIADLLSQDETRPIEWAGERLRKRIAEFEASHPRATIFVGRLVDTLAGIGL